jgi:hypothetical protein
MGGGEAAEQQPRAGRFRAALAALTWDALEGAYKALPPAQRAMLAPTRPVAQAASGSAPGLAPLLEWGLPRARVQLCVASDDDRAAFAAVGFSVLPAPLLPYGPPLPFPAPGLPFSQAASAAQCSVGRGGGRSPKGSLSRGVYGPGDGAEAGRLGLSRARGQQAQSSAGSPGWTAALSVDPARRSAAAAAAEEAAAAAAERAFELEALALTSPERIEWAALKAKRVPLGDVVRARALFFSADAHRVLPP